MIVISITHLILLSIDPIYKILGKRNRGPEVISRIFAVIFTTIAIQYIVKDLRNRIGNYFNFI